MMLTLRTCGRFAFDWYNQPMRKFFVAVILILSIVFVIASKAELESTINTLRQGNWQYLFLALLVWFIWLMSTTGIFRVIYLGLGIDEKMSNLLFLFGAANFVNIVAPSAGVSGLTVFVSEARRRGYSPARAAVAGALYLLFDYTGFSLVLGLGLIVLFRRNDLTIVEISATVILAMGISVLIYLMYQGMRSGDALASALGWMSRNVNRLLRRWIHRDYVSEAHARIFAHDAAEGLEELSRNPRKLISAIALAVLNKGLLILILALCFNSFNVSWTPGTLIASFSIGYLFMILSPTPAGLGFFEGSLTLALTSMDIPLGYAAIITLAYRGITFWLTLLFGLVSLRMLEHVGRLREIKPEEIVGD
jgi:hypothetical protein